MSVLDALAPLTEAFSQLLPQRWLSTRPMWMRLLLVPIWIAVAFALAALVVVLLAILLGTFSALTR